MLDEPADLGFLADQEHALGAHAAGARLIQREARHQNTRRGHAGEANEINDDRRAARGFGARLGDEGENDQAKERDIPERENPR